MNALRSIATIMLLVSTGQASTIVIGTANPDDGNAIPFGFTQGSVYQQVYAAQNFSGPIGISAVNFYHTAFVTELDSIATGTYRVYLSTTGAAVDGLNTTNFDANAGANEMLFFSGTLGGAVGGVLALSGSTPFLYDPSDGNLLLEIRAEYTGFQFGASIYLDAMNGDANGIFSRAQDYVTGNAGYGLVTGFTTTPEPPAAATVLLAGATLLATRFLQIRFRRR